MPLTQVFVSISDPRSARHKRHDLAELLTVAVCAVLSGIDDFVDIELWAEAKIDWLRGFMKLEHGIPSHDTIGRVFGLIAPDEKTFEYIKDKPRAPKGEAWDQAVAYWKTLHTDEGAHFDKVIVLDAANLPPIVSWGSSPEDVVSIEGVVPNPDDIADETKRVSKWRALDYMGLKPGTKMTDIAIDRVFIGSCTNGRIEDLRAAAKVLEGRHVAPTVSAMVVPGSGLVKEQAEAEGLDKIFKEAGFEWREPGCSMCLAMNDDRLKPGERCASTSNRNFEGRQGYKGRTHLVSPAMAAAAAVAGHFVDIREWQ